MVFESVRAFVRSATLDLDEGGIRADRGSDRTYFPFETLRGAKLVKLTFGTMSLLIQLGTGSWRRLTLGHHSPSTALATVQSGIEAARDPNRPRATELARKERGLRDWLGDVDSVATAGAYRSAPVKAVDLASTVGASSAAIDERAAAAYALLVHGELEHVTAVARALRGDPPPLFLALVACAPGGSILVPRDVVDDVLPYLALEDRDAILSQLEKVRDEGADARAKEAIRIVLEEEAAAIAKGGPAGKRRVRLHGSSADAMIGRTWAY